MKHNQNTMEKEVKIQITELQYNLIDKYYTWDEIFDQINYYYDTEDLRFAANKKTVRIRDRNNNYMLQIKSPDNNDRGSYSSMREENMPMEYVPEKITIDGLELLKLGAVTTNRKTRVTDNGNITICLDKSYYLNFVEFEIELEFTNKNEEIDNILSIFGLKYDTSNRGKRERFFKAIGIK